MGNIHFKLQDSTPVGGMLSGAAAEATLAPDEHVWDTDTAKRVSAGFVSPDPSWTSQQEVAKVRCVDDLFMASFCYCKSCLNAMPDAVYEGPVKLKPADAEGWGLPWRDR